MAKSGCFVAARVVRLRWRRRAIGFACGATRPLLLLLLLDRCHVTDCRWRNGGPAGRSSGVVSAGGGGEAGGKRLDLLDVARRLRFRHVFHNAPSVGNTTLGAYSILAIHETDKHPTCVHVWLQARQRAILLTQNFENVDGDLKRRHRFADNGQRSMVLVFPKESLHALRIRKDIQNVYN